MRAALTMKRLEAMVYSIGQTLALSSELDVKRSDLVLARAWAEDALKKRRAKSADRKAAAPTYTPEQRRELAEKRPRNQFGNFRKVQSDG